MFQGLRNINYVDSVNVYEETTCMNIKNVYKIINSFIHIKNPIQTHSQGKQKLVEAKKISLVLYQFPCYLSH